METPLKIAICEDLPEDADLLLRCIFESGIHAAAKIRETDTTVALAFTTSSREHAKCCR